MRCAPKTIINSHVSCVVVVGYRSLAVGSKHGFSLFSLTSIDSALEEIYSSSGEEINIVERLFSSSLVAVVSLNAPRKLKVWVNFGQSARYCTHIYNNVDLIVDFLFFIVSVAGVSFQKRNRNMQLFVFEYDTWRQTESRTFGGVPGRKSIHSQYT